MLKLLPILLMLFFALGMGARRPPNPIPAPPRPGSGVEEMPARSGSLVEIEVISLKGFEGDKEMRFRNIAANLQRVVNLKEFEVKVRTHVFNGKIQYVDTTDTPDQVFEKITSAPWKLEYRLEWLAAKSTVGYTLKSVSWIALNSRLWYSLDDAEIAANICHEYAGHKFGRYDHAQKWARSRDYSGPYGLGTICEDLYRRLIK